MAEALLAEDDTGGADEEAETLLRAAMLLMPEAPDAHQGFASLRLSQGSKEEAGAYMQTVLRIISETRLECLPSIDFRLQSAKLMMELGLLADALKILRGVEKEKDYLAELWYLFCFAHRLKGDEEAVHAAALRGIQHLRSVGGEEQARHPVTGEVLTVLDFQDIMRGVKVSDVEVNELDAMDRTNQALAREQALALSTSLGGGSCQPHDNALEEEGGDGMGEEESNKPEMRSNSQSWSTEMSE